MQIDFFDKQGLTLKTEKDIIAQGYSAVVGLDEVGRGALAGPVVAAAVSLDKSFLNKKIPSSLSRVRDSKKLSAKQREEIARTAEQLGSITYALGAVSEKIIDQTDILTATKKAMIKALNRLSVNSFFIVVDGNFSLPTQRPQASYPQADSYVFSVALASIIAKVYRDQLMVEYSHKFPGYYFERHKGYATRLHYQSIAQLGPCAIHRRSFRLTGAWQKD